MPIALNLSSEGLDLRILPGKQFQADRNLVNSIPFRYPIWENDKFVCWRFPRSSLNTILSKWDSKEIIFDESLQELVDNLRKQIIPIDELEKDPLRVSPADGKILKDYQENYVGIPPFKKRLICSFGIGTGKSISSLLRALQLGFNRILIISPKVLFKVVKDWPNSINATYGEFPFIYYGTIKQREKLRKDFLNQRIVLTNYEKVEEILKYFPIAKWDQILIDEAHNCATPNTKINKAIDKLIRLNPDAGLQLVTGTPIRNRLRDLWQLANWINPDSVGSMSSFLDKYEIPTKFKDITKNGRKFRIPIAWKYQNQEELFNKLKSIMVRVDIKDYVNWEDRTEIVSCEMTPKQQSLYNAAKEEILIELETKQLQINNVLTRCLRLLQISEGMFNLEEGNLESGKLDYIRYELDNTDDKVAIWSRFVPIGYEIQKLYPDQAVVHNGEMPDGLRLLSVMAFEGVKSQEDLEEFNRLKKYYPDFRFGPGEARIFSSTIHLRSGIGMNLKSCSHQIASSFDFTEAANLQAFGRIKRLDSAFDTLYTKRLTSENTIESWALHKLLTKSRNYSIILDGKETFSTRLSNYEMLRMLRG